jgi:hypothetical protein
MPPNRLEAETAGKDERFIQFTPVFCYAVFSIRIGYADPDPALKMIAKYESS